MFPNFSAKVLPKQERDEKIRVLVDWWRGIPFHPLKFCVYLGFEALNLVIVVFQGSKLYFLPCFIANSDFSLSVSSARDVFHVDLTYHICLVNDTYFCSTMESIPQSFDN